MHHKNPRIKVVRIVMVRFTPYFIPKNLEVDLLLLLLLLFKSCYLNDTVPT
mgnify:CR=1 FL=1